MSKTPRYRLVLAMALCLQAACAASSETEDGSPSPECVIDEGCPDGFSCQFGICAEEQARGLTIALLIQPPAFKPYLSALHVTELPVTLGDPLPDYALRAPVDVRGFVLFNAVAPDVGAPVDAELRFVNTQGIPGEQYGTTVRTDPATGGYVVNLPPGIYTASIRPERDDVSQTNVFDVEVRNPDEFRPFNLPAPEQYIRVAGRVERDELQVRGVDGARVFGVSTDGRFETTVGVSTDGGHFIVFAPPSDTSYIFHVRPDDEASDVPTLVFEPIAIPAESRSFGLTLWTGPWHERVSTPFRIESPEGMPVTEAVVVARTAVDPSASADGAPGIVDGHHDVRIDSAAIDDDGLFELDIAPGRTTVYAAALDAEFGLAAPVLLAVDATVDVVVPVPIIVEQRHPVSGRVVASSDAGIPGAEVEFTLISTAERPLDRYPVPSQLFGATARTDEDGRFQVVAQPGDYRVTAIPPEQIGHARTATSLEVGRGLVEGYTIELPESGVVSGRVLDDLNAPLAGATVQAFIVEGSAATLLATAVADADGTYRLVLPAPR